jgi:hypothetical protein
MQKIAIMTMALLVVLAGSTVYFTGAEGIQEIGGRIVAFSAKII